MAEFIWGTDYRQYLQKQAYVNDIRDAQRSAAQDTIAAIGASSRLILLGVEGGMGRIADAQREAAEMTAAATERSADRIVGAIDELDSTFRWGFGQVIGTLGGMSTSLAALVQTAKTPAQTAAYEQFEIARDAFRKRLYSECLEALSTAISGDHTSPGYKLEWRFHQLVGVVRLGFPGCDVSLVDPAAAEQSFLLATRYARADEPGEAARALFSAGWAAFVQDKLSDALEHTEGAIAIDANFAEALFQSAKIRMAQGDPDAALPVLRRAINLDNGYAPRAAGDDVFRRHLRSVDAFLDALRKEKARTLQPGARTRLAELVPLIAKSADLAGHPTVRRLTKVAEADSLMGLMDLFGFEKDSEKDAEELSAFISLLAGRRRREPRDVSVDREIEENYDVQETVAGFFRNRIVNVRKSRIVRRTTKEQWSVCVNGFGDVISTGLERLMEGEADFLKKVRILVRPGTFAMGDSALLKHDVTITRPFLMHATPVTQAQWETITGDNPSYENPDHPVEHVSWFDAIRYCNALSRAEGLKEAYVIEGSSVRWKGLDALGYRLPTEAEWEYACRAGTSGDRHGDLDAVAWWKGNSGLMVHPVGQKLPNPWGFFDMLGNVTEWCWDAWAPYPRGAAADPVGPALSRNEMHVARGGGYCYDARYAQAGERSMGVQAPLKGVPLFCVGFRPVRSFDKAV